MTQHDQRMWRAALASSPDTLVTYDEAVDALPLEEDAARAWLDEHGRPVHPGVYRWGDLQDTMLGEGVPILTWKDASRVLGVSVHVINRARNKAGCADPPSWRNPDELRDWWHRLHRPSSRSSSSPRTRRPKPRPSSPATSGPTNFHTIATER